MSRESSMPTNFRRYVLTSASHLSVSELAENYQVTEYLIRKWMRLTGIGKRPRSNGIEKLQIEKFFNRGLSVREISKMVGCSISSVQKCRNGNVI